MFLLRSTYTSAELSHFVGRGRATDHDANYQTLLKVLASGCVSHRPHQSGWGSTGYTLDPNASLLTEELIVPTVTCYCDIPFENKQLAIHAEKYGRFGVSFKRELLVKYGARPVIYVPYRPSDSWGSPYGIPLLRDIEAVYRSFVTYLVQPNEHSVPTPRQLGVSPSTMEDTIRALQAVLEKEFLAFIKPFNADLVDTDRQNYYLEREWRKYGNLPFNESTVEHVLIAPGFVERLKRDAPGFADKIHVVAW